MFGHTDEQSRPILMGILNVTPDSFSDGGLHLDPERACEHAEAMLAAGADLVDVGGESTRPGAAAVDAATQIARVQPVVAELCKRSPTCQRVSVDTRDAVVARAALAAGATLINDISAGSDAAMFPCVAEHDAGIVLMHMQGSPATMQDAPRYGDVVTEVRDYLLQRADAAVAAGIAAERIAIDPGIGFGKTRAHNLELLAGLETLVATGLTVLLGSSRKRFMGAICAETEFTRLVHATAATTALGVAAGVRIFRVHDIRANRQAADVAWAVRYPHAQTSSEAP